MKKIVSGLLLLGVMLVFAGCSTTNIDCSYSGMKTVNGNAIAHVNTINSGCQLFGLWTLWGRTSMKNTFNDFMDEAKRLNGSKIMVTNSDHRQDWAWFPPISWIFVVQSEEVAGDVYP